MPLLALGVEHKTAPLAVRERLSMDRDTIARISRTLAARDSVGEVAVLSTCNRTEIYLQAEDLESAVEEARPLLPAGNYLQVWRELDVVEHLFRVASGLESQVLGEEQILSQVREALEIAQALEVVGPNLHNLFRSAISCARQARAGTALGRVGPSIGSSAVREAEDVVGPLQDRVALVIGGGEMARLVARELAQVPVKDLIIANRTASVAQEIAREVHAKPASLTDVPSVLPRMDLVISATSAPHFMLTVESFAGVKQRSRIMHIFDLAVPRDVDPDVAGIDGISLHDLDSLLPSGLDALWEADIASMEAVIAAEAQEYMAWHLTRRVVPVIANLRSHVEAVQRQEMKRVAPQLQDLTDRERAAVDSLTSRLIDKMFHHLVLRLRLAAQTDPALVDAAEFFFLHGEGGLFEHAAQTEQRQHEETPR